jgi:mannose-6-phosphate isomerase-like protein (cupin superfamily)
MDELARAILREILPSEKDVAAPRAQNTDEAEPALDHLASPILLERAAYLRKLAHFNPDGAASDVLKQYPRHAIHLLVRTRNGGAEQHARFADLFIVLQGCPSLATGGVISKAQTIAPGEIRGDAVENGSVQHLRPGDLAHVPAGLPHQMLVPGDKPITCLVLKIEQSEEARA